MSQNIFKMKIFGLLKTHFYLIIFTGCTARGSFLTPALVLKLCVPTPPSQDSRENVQHLAIFLSGMLPLHRSGLKVACAVGSAVWPGGFFSTEWPAHM
jgi:hypothetical protein